MSKDEYIKIVKEKLNEKSSNIMINQINKYFDFKDKINISNNYKIGDLVYLKKGTLLHGTYKNLDGLREIVNDGLLSSYFIDARTSKYPNSVCVWNLKKDYYLKDYINFYSGGTILCFSHDDSKSMSSVISYSDMSNIMNIIKDNGYLTWKMEQTKEARFLPSLVQNQSQIGIIFDGNNELVKELLMGDILNVDNIDDENVKDFVNEKYYEQFIIDRKNKDDFFTDRESAIIFGIPSSAIEGILVGRIYEKDNKILNEIKELLPNAYICNLDGVVIK